MTILIRITDTISIKDGGNDFVVAVTSKAGQPAKHARNLYFNSLEQALEEAYDIALKQGMATNEAEDLKSALGAIKKVQDDFYARMLQLGVELSSQYEAAKVGKQANGYRTFTMAN